MGAFYSQDKPTQPAEPRVVRYVCDITDEELRQELGEPPYKFEPKVDSKKLYGCRREQPALRKRHEWPFTWKSWFKRLFLRGWTPFEQRGRYHDYPRFLPSSTIFPILVRKTVRQLLFWRNK